MSTCARVAILQILTSFCCSEGDLLKGGRRRHRFKEEKNKWHGQWNIARTYKSFFILSFQSGDESWLTSCHFSHAHPSLLATWQWQLSHSFLSHSLSHTISFFTLFFLPLHYSNFALGTRFQLFFLRECVNIPLWHWLFCSPVIQVLLWSSHRSACGLATGHLIQSEW